MRPKYLYAMYCHDFGRKFSFHAPNQESADLKARQYCRYHSMPNQFYAIPIENQDETHDLHNEYVTR